MDKKIKNIIEKYITFEKSFNQKLAIVIVANVESLTQNFDDYENTSVLSEYYTVDEFETISITYKKLGYEVFCFFSEDDFMDAIINQKIKTNKKLLVINSAQTGIYIGRKSLIPAFCDHYKIMHTGSNTYVVSLCRDKFHTNAIINSFVDYHLNTYLFHKSKKWLNNIKPQIDERVIIKLNGESASIGLTTDNIIYYKGQESDNYIYSLSEKYNQPIIVQQFISGYEVELPIIISNINTALFPAGISHNGNIYIGDYILDYSSRYNHLYDFYNLNEYNTELTLKLMQEASKISQILGMEGFCRIDFRIDNNNQYFVSDIACNPHITKDSSFAYIFKEMGYSYSEMFSCLIGCTLTNYYKSLQ